MTIENEEFKLKLTGAGISIDRQIGNDIAQRVIALVMGSAVVEPVRAVSSANNSASAADVSSPKSFMAGKRPTTDMEKITCLSYFLTHHRKTTTFKTKDLTDLNIEAAQPKLSNASATARNAVSIGLLSLAGGGHKQITTRGEALVEALPDRDKAKEAIAQHPVRKPRKRARSRARRMK